MKALLISLAVVCGAIIALAFLYDLWRREALDRPIEIEAADPSDVVRFKTLFIEACSKGMEDALRDQGLSLDGDRPEKIRFTCGCAIVELTPRIEGLTPRQLEEIPKDSALAHESEKVMRRCAESVGLR